MAAKRKPTRVIAKRRQTALAVAPAELREETQVRRLRAKLEVNTLKSAMAALATYKAADKGRENKDWRASAASADAAYIPDAPTIMARCRAVVRDSWQGRAIVKAFTRNVVQNGILPVPQPRGADGAIDATLAKQMLGQFFAWANDPQSCDVCGEQTFWQMQSLAESERVTVGEAFFIWSYSPATDARAPLGLRLQQFESEQLDQNLQSYKAGDTTNEVRGGVEVDAFGKAVAYHVYDRNPNDYLLGSTSSTRIAASRVLRYKRKDRVGLTRGVSDMASVLQMIRNCWRVDNAAMWRMIMESCIGIIIKQENPGGTGAFSTMPRAAGDTGTTASGMSTVDLVPGMVARTGVNESIESFIPQSPGNQFEPFMQSQHRGIAAGAGIGYGQFTMDFTKGTYSGQRQEMLETRREFEPLQELLAHSIMLPLWRLFVSLSVAEGRIDIPDFESDHRRYTECDYIAPPMPWIDPEKEVSAAEKAINLKVMDRGELALMRGVRLEDVWDRIEQQTKDAESRGIVLAENKVDDNLGGKVEAYGVAVRAGAITPNADDEAHWRKVTGLPAMPSAVSKAWDEQGGIKQPITIQSGEQSKVVEGEPKPAPAALATLDAPNYRATEGEPPQRCATCSHARGGKCAAYDFACTPACVCDSWEAVPLGNDHGKLVETPPVPDGNRPMNDVRSDFNDRAARGVS
jgi:lambda family phage portal protein